MGHVILNTGACTGVEVPISNTAAETVRMKFNPSNLPRVDRLKSLAAALISECEAIRDECEAIHDERGPGAREAAVAITQLQGASMFAVAAATAHLG